MCIHIIYMFCHAQLCMNDYFVPNLFPMIFCKVGLFSCFLASFASTADEVEHPWCLSSRCEFLGVTRSNVSTLPSI